MVKWEYGTLRNPKVKNNLDEELTKLGAEGWEAWHMDLETSPNTVNHVVRLKRIVKDA